MSSLDNARKSAKRWLQALRAHDRDARERLRRAYPAAPSDPTLRDVQHALARERGYDGWTALKATLEGGTRPMASVPAHPDRVADFFEFACWDHHTHGRGDYAMHQRAAARLLEQHPEIARHSLYTAIVCGDIDEVTRVLAERPDAAREPGGSRGWPPILYLCYGRVPVPPARDHALTIARALLDTGADPNAYYMAGDAKYSALVGVAGEGEQDAPPHPHREALFALLLQRGANPYDIQILYNTHFHGEVLWWLELIYAQAVKTGRLSEWQDPNWAMLDMGGYGPGAYFLFRIAVEHNDLRLARWLLTHGASPNAHASAHPKFEPARTTLEEARRRGHTELVDLLARYGAVAKVLVPDEEDADRIAFAEACVTLDRDGAAAHLQRHPEYLSSTEVMFEAARRDRADVVGFLHSLGMSIDVESRSGQRPLHVAAGNNALAVAAFLIEHGAEIDPRERQWNATPLSAACYAHVQEMIQLLSPVSRDVWSLAKTGNVERLREVLTSEPALATQVSRNGLTPLWWLPDDEEHAVLVVDLFLARGADPSVRAGDGSTAADYARKRGLEEAARRLGVFGQELQAPGAAVEKYDALARDLVVAYEMGDAAAMERLQRHYRRTIAWDELREGVRRRLSMAGRPERPADYFGLPQARMLVAREAGFENWLALTKAVENDPAISVGTATQGPPDPGIVGPG
jgi:ankyrin repeat protein